jgi:hypothetical protein
LARVSQLAEDEKKRKLADEAKQQEEMTAEKKRRVEQASQADASPSEKTPTNVTPEAAAALSVEAPALAADAPRNAGPAELQQGESFAPIDTTLLKGDIVICTSDIPQLNNARATITRVSKLKVSVLVAGESKGTRDFYNSKVQKVNLAPALAAPAGSKAKAEISPATAQLSAKEQAEALYGSLAEWKDGE